MSIILLCPTPPHLPLHIVPRSPVDAPKTMMIYIYMDHHFLFSVQRCKTLVTLGFLRPHRYALEIFVEVSLPLDWRKHGVNNSFDYFQLQME